MLAPLRVLSTGCCLGWGMLCVLLWQHGAMQLQATVLHAHSLWTCARLWQHACLLRTGLVCRVPAQQMLSSSHCSRVGEQHLVGCMGLLTVATHVVGVEPHWVMLVTTGILPDFIFGTGRAVALRSVGCGRPGKWLVGLRVGTGVCTQSIACMQMQGAATMCMAAHIHMCQGCVLCPSSLRHSV